jgi:oxygen-independent coproporphyrinogen-3 oxidase
MAFFHGISFPESEDEDVDKMSLYASLTKGESEMVASVRLCDDNFETQKSITYLLNACESEERAAKTAIGQAIYLACKELTGKDIPWGLLTGIRPSKVCYELLKSVGEDKTRQILKNRYLLSEQRIDLAIAVAKNEGSIMSLTNDNKCSIYVSIPFCPSRCNYCSFISYAGKKLFDLIPDYVNRICVDIKETVKLINEIGLEISCVYIGGGTPTMLNEEQLEKVLGTIAEILDVSSLDEFTLEGGRPDTITERKLKIAKKYGVNRISVNPQTLNDDVLTAIGRHHTVSEFFDAFEKVKNSEIRSINTDLIAGLDGDNLDSFKRTVDKIIDLSPDNVTVHTFCVKKSA